MESLKFNYNQNIEKLYSIMQSCRLCPRNCGVNRLADETGYCGIGSKLLISSAGPHYGEESVLVGNGGSGTIFFSGCNLGCMFCQNFQISHDREGVEITVDKLVEFMLSLEKQGCENINFVTPTHVISHIADAIVRARSKGLTIPTVYNSGGFDSVEILELIDGLIEIYMPDMKYSDGRFAEKLSEAKIYPQINRLAVKEMHRQVGDLEVKNGIAVKGLLIRHLVLPNGAAGTEPIIDFLADEISENTAINIMDQYKPCYKAFSNSSMSRRPTSLEISSAIDYAAKKGLRIIS